jgi:hypothetical protein
LRKSIDAPSTKLMGVEPTVLSCATLASFQARNEKFDFVFGDLTDIPVSPDFPDPGNEPGFCSSQNQQVKKGGRMIL